jgi:hypothetical protein
MADLLAQTVRRRAVSERAYKPGGTSEVNGHGNV